MRLRTGPAEHPYLLVAAHSRDWLRDYINELERRSSLLDSVRDRALVRRLHNVDVVGVAAVYDLARGLDADPVAAHPTKQECEQAISAILRSFAPTQTSAVAKEPSRGEVYVTHTSANGESWTHGFRYVCLPDTVDPRAPKSAGR